MKVFRTSWIVNVLFFIVLHNTYTNASVLQWVLSSIFTIPSRAPVRLPIACGRKLQERIVGGNEAPPSAWPWMASLQNWSGRHFCAGTFITERHVISAAHCLKWYKFLPCLLKVGAGSSWLGSGITFDVYSVTIHPSFGQRSLFDSDIAIVTLTEDVNFSRRILSICLPRIAPLALPFPSDLTILGWGFSKENGKSEQNLRETNVQLLSHEKCAQYDPLYIPDVMFCAGWKTGGKDACKGDSGGPILRQDDEGRWVLLGIISFGKGCGRKEFPGVYTKVFNFNDWIIKTVSSN